MANVDKKQTQTDADTPKMHQVAYLTMQMPIEETKDLFKNINRFITNESLPICVVRVVFKFSHGFVNSF